MARLAPMTPVYKRGAEKLRTTPVFPGQRRPRKRDKAHLACVAKLFCVVPECGLSPVHVAHIRFACAIEGAALTGKSTKPDDWRTLPLCPGHHLEGASAQHGMNEEMFWAELGINPYAMAKALYNLSGDLPKMRFVISHARELFPARAQT